MEKSGIFVGHPVLDSGRDNGTARGSGQWTVDSGQWTVDSGQWTVDSGQWTEGLSSMGQRDTGRAILYWTETARDSWTVDGTEWTEALSLL